MKKLRIFFLLCMAVSLLAVAGVAEEISDDWMDFQVSINGQVYTLPVPFEDLAADGWALESPEETLKPNQYALSQKITNGDMYFYGQVINLGIDVLPQGQCLVGQVSIDEYDAERGGVAVAVAHGIALGDDREAVEAAFGPSGNIYEGSSSVSLKYESSSYNQMEVKIDSETGLVSKLTVRCFDTPEGYNDAALAAPVEIPQEVLDYAPPTELGDDLLSFNIRVGDALYTIPASYQYMQEQGWSVGQKMEGKIAADDYARSVPLNLSGYKVSTQLYNPTDTATLPEYCFVTTLRFDSNFTQEVELPRGISMGMSREDFLAALEGTEYDISESEYSSTYGYTIKKDILEEVYIGIDKEKNAITTIEVKCMP